MRIATREPRVQGPRAKVQSPRSKIGPRIAPLLVLISAPSGGGKTTLCQQLLEARPDMERVVTCTTRQPRPGEKDGVDYHFLDANSFVKQVEAGEFLEHATVYGHNYGTLKSEVLTKLRRGKDVLLNVDVQGAATIRAQAQHHPELKQALVSVFLTPASLGILEERLRKRSTDTPAVIRKRLSVARQEIAQWRNFDYLLISDSVQEDRRRMLAIVEAEKMRITRAQPPGLRVQSPKSKFRVSGSVDSPINDSTI